MKLKKIINFIFIVLFCPVVMGAVANQAGAPSDQNGVDNNAQTLNLTSDLFGLQGPFSVGVQYSKEQGAIVNGSFTHRVMASNAVSLGAEVGPNQHRVNATFGQAITNKQRVKLTAEYLAQDMNFDFAAGSTDQWVEQPAYGISYEYLIAQKYLHDFNLNATYSRAISQSLSTQHFTNDSGAWTDYRHIAGATDKSLSGGVNVLPTKTTMVGLNLNYDQVRYHTRYDTTNAQNASGLGETISLDQLITNRVKLSFLASNRKPYEDYKASVGYLLHSKPGSQLELSVSADRLLGQTGTGNDSRVGINLAYTFGGNPVSHPAEYSFSTNNTMDDLTNWVKQPAVHMEQVLAVQDEKVVAGTLLTPHNPVTASSQNEIDVAAGKPVDIHVSDYMNDQSGDYIVTNLPSELQYKDGEITGKFSDENVGETFSVNVTENKPASLQASGKMSDLQPAMMVLMIKVKSSYVPYPNPDFHPAIKQVQEGETFTYTNVALAYSSPDIQGMFFDPTYRDKRTSFNTDEVRQTLVANGFSNVSVVYNISANTFTINATAPTSVAICDLSVNASNIYGWSATPVNLTIQVGTPTPKNPSFTTQPTNISGLQGSTPTYANPFAVASAGGSTDTFDTTHTVTITTVSGGKTLDQLGITKTITNAADGKTATVTLAGSLTGAVGTYKYKMTAENVATKKVDSNEFTVTISPVPGHPSFTKEPTDISGLQGSTPTYADPYAVAKAGDATDTFDTTHTVVITPISGTTTPITDLGITTNITKSTDSKTETVKFAGALSGTVGTYTYKMTATNVAGNATDSTTFTVTINPVPGTPSFTTQPTDISGLQGSTPQYATPYAVAAPGSNSTFDTTHTVTITTVSGGKTLQELGITPTINTQSDGATVTLAGALSGPVGTYKYKMTAENVATKKVDSNEFTVTISPVPGHPSYSVQPTDISAIQGATPTYADPYAVAKAGDATDTFDTTHTVVITPISGTTTPITDLGITTNITKSTDSKTETVKFTGALSGAVGTYTYKMTATNVAGNATDSTTFIVTINAPPQNPTFNPNPPTGITGELNQAISATQLTVATAGGSTDAFADNTKVVINKANGNTKTLANLGLTPTFTLSTDKKTITVSVAGTLTSADALPHEYDYTMTATNVGNKSATSDVFKVTINPTKPTFNIPAQTYVLGTPVSVDITSDINFGGVAELTKAEASNLATYGLAMNLSTDKKHVTIAGTPTTAVSNVTIPVTIGNSAGDTAGSFSLTINGINPGQVVTVQCPQTGTFNPTTKMFTATVTDSVGHTYTYTTLDPVTTSSDPKITALYRADWNEGDTTNHKGLLRCVVRFDNAPGTWPMVPTNWKDNPMPPGTLYEKPKFTHLAADVTICNNPTPFAGGFDTCQFQYTKK